MLVMLSDLVVDIVKNACTSGADTVELEIMEIGPEFRFLVKDNGKGMSQDEAETAIGHLDIPEHTGKGLGLPFLIQTVAESAGGWDLHTEKNIGTTITVWFDVDNPETPLVGDLASMFATALTFSGPSEFIIRRIRKTGHNDVRYEIRKTELASALGGLADAGSLALLNTYLHSLENPHEPYAMESS